MKIETGKYKILLLLFLVISLSTVILISVFFFKEVEENQKEPILYEEIQVKIDTPIESEIFCTFLVPPYREELEITTQEDYDLFIKSIFLNSYQDFTKSSIAQNPDFKDVDSVKFEKDCSKYLEIEEINFESKYLVGDILETKACNAFFDIQFSAEAYTNLNKLVVGAEPLVESSDCNTVYRKGYFLAFPQKFSEFTIEF